MNLLAIDTSTERATVALAAHGEIMSEEQTQFKQHAQFLLPMIEQLLKKAHLSFNQLEGIAFGKGPGSFTGIRIACSIAKGLAYAHDLPIYPVGSLVAIANEARFTNKLDVDVDILAVMDARMDELYWGCFKDTLYEAEEHVSCPAHINIDTSKPILLAGVGFEPYISRLPKELQACIVKQSIIYPNAITMIRLAQEGGIKPHSAASALPVYVRNQVTYGTTAKGEVSG
jgi:tRNA threonylcarbamoyladenosine biosynthesis protein TsaB